MSEGIRTFKVSLRIGTSGKGPIYHRTHSSLTPDTAVVESMMVFWEATGVEPEKLTLVCVTEIVPDARH